MTHSPNLLVPSDRFAGAGAADPLQLHPALWRAHQLGQQRDDVVPSGFAALDAELPGGGWPTRALTELLLPHPGVGELRLLAPALVAVQQGGRSLMWFDPPALPCGWTLSALGLDLRQLVIVRARDGLAAQHPARTRLQAPADVLWALEQTLRSGHVGAVLAWLPANVRLPSLRRLQLAAQAHDGPAFLLCEAAALVRPSVAPLRLTLSPAGADTLALRIVKRRGPPSTTALHLELMPTLSAQARARARAQAGRVARQIAGETAAGVVGPAASSAFARISGRTPSRSST